MLSFYVNPKEKEEIEKGEKAMKGKGGKGGAKKDSVKIEIYDAAGDLVNTLRVVPDTGLNRSYWGMDSKGPKFPSRRPARPGGFRFGGGGGSIMPGMYKAVMTYLESKDSTEIEVIMDPRAHSSEKENLKALIGLQKEGATHIKILNTSVEKLKKALGSLKQVNGLLDKGPKADTTHKAIAKESKAMGKEINKLLDAVFGLEGKQGIYRDPNTILSTVSTPGRYLRSSSVGKTGMATTALKLAKEAAMKFEKQTDSFFEDSWKAFQEKVEALDLSPFKE